MKPAPVSACLIVKNESGQLKSCLESIRPYVSEICIVDTGSSDSTPEIARSLADKFEIYTDCNDSDGRIKSFAQARQRSFEMASQPWLFWVDGDDEVVGAEHIIQLVEKHDQDRNGQACMIMLPYEYSHDHLGNPTCVHYRERLVTTIHDFKWIGPVHEVLSPVVPNVLMFKSDATKMVHRRHQSGKSIEPNRNLRILKNYYDQIGESEVRTLYYLGLEYANAGDLGNSIKFHRRYIELSGWDDEKCLACLEIARHYQTLGDYDNSIEWALKSSTIKEGWAEPYFSLARSYYFMAQRGGPDERRNWERSIYFVRAGLALPPTNTVLFVNPLERSFDIHKFLNMALNKIGDVTGALASVKQGLSVCPDDASLKLNESLYEEHISKRTIAEHLTKLVGSGKLSDDAQRIITETLEGRFVIKNVVESNLVIQQPNIDTSAVLPSVISDCPMVEKIQSLDPLDIVIYVGPGLESWNPNTFDSGGMGGSETMAWEMSWRLARLGHKIRVYGDCPNMEGIFRGVQFLNHEKFPGTKCDVLITSRRPHIMDVEYNIQAKIRLCWVHDVTCGSELTHVRGLRIDRFLVLSQWHREFFLSKYAFIHPDQVLVTRNAIDLSRFDGHEIRNPHRAIYSSSPDRGLEVAIRAIQRVRNQIPDAELHVFYGFKNWERSANLANDAGQINLIKHVQKLIDDNANNGVIFHDRVSQKQLAREFMKSGVWTYPTWFAETSCITAMEAQAAGLRIVTSPIAALTETVAQRGMMIAGDWLSKDYLERFVNSVIDSMARPGDTDRQRLIQYAHDSFGFDALATEWDAMLHRVLVEVERDVVPPYKSAV
jgi:glycosyltransferase involved in cell wall biosynthesis